MATLSACVLLMLATGVSAQSLVNVDPSKAWAGYMSVSDLPADGGGFQFGGPWGPADLRAIFPGNGQLVLSPNTNVWNPTDAYWVKADNSPNKQMDASFYVQDDSLSAQDVTFTATCLSNNLAAGYTSQAFIKIFDGNYGLLGAVTTNLVAGQTFSISLNAGAAAHVQYGFETVGPDANPATVAELGEVVIAVPASGVTVGTDPAKYWAGYMAWSPVDAGSAFGGYGASAWGLADLQASFSETNLVLAPSTNTYDPASTYWVNTDTGAGANIMTASCYVTDDTLANTNVTFTGFCRSSTLNSGYLAYAFIKIFSADYSYLGGAYSGQLTGGQSFSISLATVGAVHVQYGYEMVGPNAKPSDAAGLGNVVLATTAPVAAPAELQAPTNSAPTPALPASAVVSMYTSSGVYPESLGINWYATWGAVGSQGDYTITNTSVVVKKYGGLQYAGMEFYANPINVFACNTFHLDIWTPNANQLGIKLVSLTGGTQDPQVNILPSSGLITSNQWIGIDIPLSAFQNANTNFVWDPSNLQQMLLVDNSSAGPGVQGGTFYVDNAYFYTAAPAPPDLRVELSAGRINLSFPTVNGTSYTVLYKTNLTDATWQTLTNFSGTGSVYLISEPDGRTSRFYRVSFAQ